MTFRVGQKVVCIDAEIHNKYAAAGYSYRGGMDGLKEGVIYTVRDVAYCKLHNTLTILVQEIVRPVCPLIGCESPFAAARFRPVQEQGMSILRAIADNPKQKIKENA